MDQARREESPEELQHASQRVLTWYLRSADAAQGWINPGEHRVPFQIAIGEVQPKAFGSYEEALQWFERERGNLVAAVSAARAQGWHEIAWRLAVVLRSIFMRFNPFEDWITTSQVGLHSAEDVGDRHGQAELLESLGMAFAQSHDLNRAAEFHRRALDARRELDDRLGSALSLNDLGLVQLRRHQWGEAAAMFEEALEIFDALGDGYWPPVLRANLAEALIGTGQHAQAEALVGAALAAFRERDDAGGEGNALRLLSMVRRGAGDANAALGFATMAVAIAREYRVPMWEGYWLIELGTAQHLTAHPADALESFEHAALLQHRIGDKAREALALASMAEALAATGRGGEGRDKAAEAMRLIAAYTDPASEELKARLNAIS
jgi:tetratricopeptide (TPR) repeat protein